MDGLVQQQRASGPHELYLTRHQVLIRIAMNRPSSSVSTTSLFLDMEASIPPPGPRTFHPATKATISHYQPFRTYRAPSLAYTHHIPRTHPALDPSPEMVHLHQPLKSYHITVLVISLYPLVPFILLWHQAKRSAQEETSNERTRHRLSYLSLDSRTASLLSFLHFCSCLDRTFQCCLIPSREWRGKHCAGHIHCDHFWKPGRLVLFVFTC